MSDVSAGDRTLVAVPDESDLRFQSLKPGVLFAGRYSIIETLGSGGAGVVYRALDRTADSEIALKVLYPGAVSSDLERLRREQRILRELCHPGIPRLFHIDTTGGLRYTVSDLLSGESLREHLERAGPLEPGRAVEIARGVLEVLAAAHRKGVIHRDVKPGNIFLARGREGGEERVMLLDFGLARSITGKRETTVGRFLGTPEYSSPEQVRGDADLGPATDLYATGVTFWEMLSGAPPFHGDSDVAILNAHLHRQPPDPARTLRGAPHHLRELLLRLLEKDPGRRPRNADEVLALLDRPGRLGWAGDRLRRLMRRKRSRILLAAAAILAAAVVGWWGLEPREVFVVEPDGTSIDVRTRIGFALSRSPMEGRIQAAVPDTTGRGLSRGIWLSAAPPEGLDMRTLQGNNGSILHYMSTPFSPARPFAPATMSGYLQRPYPGFSTPFEPCDIYPLGHVRRSGEAMIAVGSRQSPAYPYFINLYLENDARVPFYHPGHRIKATAFRTGDGDPLNLLFLAQNNLAGPRPALFALPATGDAFGQAPPYTANVNEIPREPSWYTFLPYRGYFHLDKLVVDGARGVVEVSLPPRFRMTVDLSTGVPLEAEHRGGLSEEEWAAARAELLETLWQVAGLDQTEQFIAGAELLERYAARVRLAPEQRSVAFYRAACLRKKSAVTEGMSAYRKALENARVAFELERIAPRHGLLVAELNGRLGNLDAVIEALRNWGRQREELAYVYDWYVVARLFGGAVPPERVLDHRNDLQTAMNAWVLLIRLNEAHRTGDHDAIPRFLEDYPVPRAIWSIHYYWAARAMLDRSPPDPERAVAFLERAGEVLSEGTFLPVEAARLHAEALAGRGGVSDERDRQAMEEVERLRELSFHDPIALFLLPFAERDLASGKR